MKIKTVKKSVHVNLYFSQICLKNNHLNLLVNFWTKLGKNDHGVVTGLWESLASVPTTELHCLPDCLFVFSLILFFVLECKVAIQLIWSIPLLFQAADKAACGKNICMLPYVYCRGVGAGMGRVGWVGNCPLKVLGNRMIVSGGFPIYCLPNQIINASYTTVIYLTLQHIFLPVYILSV